MTTMLLCALRCTVLRTMLGTCAHSHTLRSGHEHTLTVLNMTFGTVSALTSCTGCPVLDSSSALATRASCLCTVGCNLAVSDMRHLSQ